MTLSQISTPLTREQAYALVDAVTAREDLAITASAHEDEATGEWVFEATCGEAPEVSAFAAIARQVLGGDVDFTVESIDPSIDWVARSLEGLKPVVAGGFYIHGSHEASPPPAGATPILIDAAQAFGTGHHETTTGCLEAIGHELKRRRVRSPIDVGTGTGVLAIAMAKRQHVHVIASDIDPVSVRTTRQNARANGVPNEISAIHATALNHRTIAAHAPYDLIVANILAGPLTAMAPAIRRVAAPGATIILSGLLTGQAPRVLSAYRAQSMLLTRRIIRKDWETLVLEKR